MATQDIGTLKALFSLDSSKFDRGMKNVQKGTNKTKAGLNALKGVLVAAFSVVAIKSFVQATLSSADAIGKFADRAGITTDRLQSMTFAFDLAGVGAEKVNKAVLVFGKRLGKARQGIGALVGGLKGGQEELLETLLRTSDVNQALDVMFVAMGKAKNQAEKLAIADAAFGTAGLQMTAAFKEGAEAFYEAEQQARDLGLVIDEDLIRNAEALNDQMNIAVRLMGIQMKAAFLGIAPVITKIVGEFIELNKQIDKLTSPATLKGFAGFTRIAMAARMTGFKMFAELGALTGNEFLENTGRGALQAEKDKLDAGIKKFNDKNPGKIGLNKTAPPGSKGIPEEIIEQGPMPGSLQNIGGNHFGGPLGSGFIDGGADAEFLRNKEEQLQRIIKSSHRYIGNLENQNKIEGLRLDGQKELADEIEREITLRSMYGDFVGQITEKDRERLKKAQEEQERLNGKLEEQNKIAEIGKRVFDHFGDGVVRVMQEGGNAIDAMKDSALAALFDIQREIFKLAFNPIKDAAVAGATSLIKGFFGGFAHGGSFIVPGGGGTDSSPVSFMATPGERVEVSTPGQNSGGGGGGGSVTINQNISTGVAQTVRAELMGMLPQIIERTKKGVLDAKLRGGGFAEAF